MQKKCELTLSEHLYESWTSSLFNIRYCESEKSRLIAILSKSETYSFLPICQILSRVDSNVLNLDAAIQVQSAFVRGAVTSANAYQFPENQGEPIGYYNLLVFDTKSHHYIQFKIHLIDFGDFILCYHASEINHQHEFRNFLLGSVLRELYQTGEVNASGFIHASEFHREQIEKLKENCCRHQ